MPLVSSKQAESRQLTDFFLICLWLLKGTFAATFDILIRIVDGIIPQLLHAFHFVSCDAADVTSIINYTYTRQAYL